MIGALRRHTPTVQGRGWIKKPGTRIRLARVEADLTQTELAHKIRAKQKSISPYETGASVPTIDTLMKIASVLKKPSSYFLEGSS